MPDAEKPLAPLPMSVLKQIQTLQADTRRALKRCNFHRTKQLDDRSALETLRSHLVAEIDLRLGFYETFPDYEWDWNTEILSHAAASALACFPLDWFEQKDATGRVLGYEGNEQFMKALVSTGWEYAVSRQIAKGKATSGSVASNRQALAEAYFAAFPTVRKLDVCWAAGQRYCEWKRWLRNAVKDGSTPDTSFRALLTSGKLPHEYKKAPRPRGWK